MIFVLIWLDVLLGGDESLGRPGLAVGAVSLIIGLLASLEVVNFNATNNKGVKRWAVLAGTGMVIGLAYVTDL